MRIEGDDDVVRYKPKVRGRLSNKSIHKWYVQS